ncbi:tripartite tricarboxylate transporter permease [Oceanobacillus timonensis]|uniref:tripartite tricarboxylate transporter permease n=1 Tax=Oceanobacillus timonensis TaxID=1926285 RepID=UPI0015C4BD56|nr:tripartite tricarboxylate transporter permease [Oceanobacillus timonensis]
MDTIIQLFQPSVILFMILGSVLGLFIGALPGLTATMGVAVLTPLTFWLEPADGLAMLIAIYCTAIFAGDIPAILVNTPGTPASVVTTFDGYKLTQKGKEGIALGINAIYSGLGGLVSVLFLIVASVPISKFALSFGPAEYFSLAVFGLSIMISVASKSIIKGLISGFIGLFIITIGLDPIMNIPRFTYGYPPLLEGFSFIPVMIGLFGLGEVFSQMLGKNENIKVEKRKVGRIIPTKAERKEVRRPFLVSSVLATFIGAIPGAGGDIASMISWNQNKNMSKGEKKEEYGNGSLGGVTSAAVSNNAVIGGAFTTMMTLGLPGDAVTAILIGSLMMYGLDPGPALFTDNIEMVHLIFGLLIIANILVIVIGLLGSNLFSRIMLIKQEIIWVAIIIFCVIGSYAINNSYFDVWVMVIAGIAGFLFKKLDIPLGPLILALILGPMAESNFRRALVISQGDGMMIFLTSPIALILLIIAAVSIVIPVIRKLKAKETL